MQKKSRKQAFGTGWVTTDEDERNIRKMRAATAKMSVRFLGEKSIAPFGDYEVASEEGRLKKTYRVEFRALDGYINSCSCPDFQKNGLGTCKHIERVIMRAQRELNGASRSPFGEVFVARNPVGVAFVRGDAMPDGAAESVSRHFTPQGRIKINSPLAIEALLTTCERLNRKIPGVVRVSADVRALAREMRERESLAAAVGAFASRMASSDGKWPFLKTPLYPYQVEGALHLATHGRAILADEMGLGKTVQAIAAALLMRDVEDVKRVLVVAPTSLKGEWTDQIALFSDAPTELLMGDRRERLSRYAATGAFFLVTNYEQILRDWEDVNTRFKPDLVILDEAQRIKNWNTKTARTLKRLASRFAFVLTGTPLENRIDEFYSIAEFVDPSLFGSLFRFNRTYYKFDERGKSAGMQNLDDLHDKATSIMLRRRKDMVEDELPGRTDKNYFVGLTDEQAARYAEFEMKVTRLCAQAKQRPLTKEELDRLQIYLASMRMLCDSCYILDQKIRESPKADEAIKVLEDVFASDPERKVVVFSEWVKMLELVEERLEEAGIGFAVHTGSVRQDRRRAELKHFRTDPDCRVLLSSESGGVGLNLQSASVVMNLDLPWNPAKLEQRIARAWRKRQTRDVLVVNLVAEGTIEHKMLSTLKFKQGLADLVLDARGNAADFESEKSKNAFLARVSSLMESQIPSVVNANGTAAKMLDAAARVSGGASDVAAAEPNKRPPEDEVLTSETLAMLARLAKLGYITLGEAAKKRIEASESADASATAADAAANARAQAAEKRLRVAKDALAKARRTAKMASVLEAGGFADEAQAPYRESACLAAGAAYFAHGGKADETVGDIPDEVAPATLEEFFTLSTGLNLPPDASLTLQFAVQGKEIPAASTRISSFIEECAVQID